MPIDRVALIFDNTARPDTTGGYCRRALEQLTSVEHFLPTELERIPADAFDLYLFIDDGLTYSIPDRLRPAAWWAIDTHLDFERCLEKARAADFVFAAQRDGAQRLQEICQKSPEVQWLPLACDPELHGRQPVLPRYDVSFVGHFVAGPRNDLLQQIRKEFPRNWIGQCPFEEMSRIYSASRIVFNRSIGNDMNMRVFEALASGALLLTNDLAANGLEDLFRERVHLATYLAADDLLAQIAYFIEHDEERELIAAAGRAEVLARHTYRHRMQTILEVANYRRPQHRTGPRHVSTAVHRPLKSPEYFEFARPEVLALVPETARRVLDIGCGGGKLGELLKQRQTAEVTGIELNPRAAAIARRRLDQVVATNLEEELDNPFPEKQFDCVVAADVLEHLNDPLAVLKRIRRWLTSEGTLVLSLPNMQHHSIVEMLLADTWQYESAGLLDNDHVRFFTRREIEKLVHRAGFRLEALRFVPGEGFSEWEAAGRPLELQAGRLHLAGKSTADLEQFHAYQYLLTVRPRPVMERELTSIILVTCNALASTQECLARLRERTDEPYELIIVDNGSTDGTVEFLRDQPDIRLIRNSANRGFPAAVNQGLDAATGRHLLLLNNDVVVTTGWLERLHEALESRPNVGLVGPLTNCTSGLQRIAASYNRQTLDDFAWDLSRSQSGQRRSATELTGFCLLIRREVFEQVGGLDERFEVGVYEDIDFCRRAAEAGFRMLIADDVFVHHDGHQSFDDNGVIQDDLAVESAQRYQDKWNHGSPENPKPDAAQSSIGADAGALESRVADQLSRFTRENFAEQRLPVLPPPTQGLVDALLPLLSTDSRCLLVGRHGVSCAAKLREHFPQLHLTGLTADRGPDWSGCDEFQTTMIEQYEAPNWKQRFDAILCDPFCEVREPRALLQKLRAWLKPDGVLIGSFPNVRQRERIAGLMEGTWSAPPRDQNDERPLRFLSRTELEKLLDRAGFEVSDLRTCPPTRTVLPELSPDGTSSGELAIGRLQVVGLSSEQTAEFLADRYLFCARPRAEQNPGLTSIILVTHNQWAYTRKCLDSLALYTDEPYELIVVDNGSTDGTPGFLQQWEQVTLICNRENRGFPAAVNQGLQVARGQNLLLLNNDVVVTTGWLRRLLATLHADSKIGLVGPCSNHVSGEQQVAVTYDRLAGLEKFAWEWARTHTGERWETDRLVGFCLLFRRELLDRIGLLDERFGIGCFEDDDFCRRSLQAGYQAVICREAFVHHFGSRTFLASGLDFAGLLRENHQKYAAKWNSQARTDSQPPSAARRPASANVSDSGNARLPPPLSPQPLPPPPFSQRSPSQPLPPEPESDAETIPAASCKLSACLIVRDNESTIAACLESLLPWVDELIVVDTGSRDRTPQLASRFGARVHSFEWCDDFSAARNESLRHARGEWIFWMDSDDTLPADCGQQLRALADASHAPGTLGYVMQVHCPGSGADSSCDFTVVDHVKLFRNRSDLRFEGRIHEQILPAIRRAGGEVQFTGIHVIHSGADHSPTARQRKLERDLRILHRELSDQPEHPFVLFNLGMTYVDAGDHDRAANFLEQCVRISSPRESHLRKAYALLVSAHSQAGREAEAWETCQSGRGLFPDDQELQFRAALLHQHSGRLEQAAEQYRQLLATTPERYFASIDAGLGSYKAHHNLAVVYEELGDFEQAAGQWQTLLQSFPDYPAGWRGWGNWLLRQEDHAEAAQVASQLLRRSPALAREGYRLRIELAVATRNLPLAFQTLDDWDLQLPDDLEALQVRCRLLFEHATPVDAQRALRQLVQHAPDDAAAWHNLGIVTRRLGEIDDAVAAFRRSLALRPHSGSTLQQLQQVMQEATPAVSDTVTV